MTRISMARTVQKIMEKNSGHSMFHNRVITSGKKLPDSVVSSASISSFKRRLSSFVVNVGFEHFSVN